MRIATGAISHETSTFTPVTTDEASFFERHGRLEPDEIIGTFRGTNTPTGRIYRRGGRTRLLS